MPSRLAVAACLVGCAGTPQPEPPPPPSVATAPGQAGANGGTASALLRARAAIQRGEFAAAYPLAKQAAAEHPDSAEAAFYWGVAAERVNEGVEARRAYERALALDPGLLEARANLSGMFIRAEDGEAALAIVEPGLAQEPGDPLLLVHRAAALLLLGRKPETIAAYRRAVEVMPDNLSVHVALGQLLVEAGQRDEARPHLLAAADSNDPELMVAAGLTAQSGGDPATCVTLLTKALSLTESPGLTVRRAGCNADLGDRKAAEADFRRAIALKPREAVGYFYLGRFLAAGGDAKAARAALETALTLDPKAPLRGDIEALLKGLPAAKR